jgi:hypothetical protein
VIRRLLFTSALALAALLAFAVAEVVHRPGRRAIAAAAALLVLVALDLGTQPVSATAADPDNAAFAALGPGRILNLPLFDPGIHYGSVYDYYELQAPKERPQGYNTLAPRDAYSFAFTYNRIGCGVWEPGDEAELERLGVRNILLHRGVYHQAGDRSAWFAWYALEEQGWKPVAQGGAVTLFTRGSSAAPPPFAEPARTEPVFCRGWRDGTMTELQAPFWLYGAGLHELHVTAEEPTVVGISVNGHLSERRLVSGSMPVNVQLEGDTLRWQAVVVDASRPGLELDYVR